MGTEVEVEIRAKRLKAVVVATPFYKRAKIIEERVMYMKHRYLPMTEQDQKEMLEAIGVYSIDELFTDIPEKVRFKGEYNIKHAKSESALLKELSELAAKMQI